MKYITIASAIFLAVCSAYFSVVGLMEIFAGNKLYAGIAGLALEIGKISTALMLHKHWKEREIRTVRTPLVIFTVILMVLTSAGIFGMFAKGAQVHTAGNTIVSAETAMLQQKIDRNDQRKIAVEKKLDDLDKLVNLYTKEADLKDASRGVRLYSRQKQQREQLEAELLDIESTANELLTKKLEQTAKTKNVELEVGPAIYLAEIIYGDKGPEAVDKAIRIVILMIVFVFDPLTICLLIAAQTLYSKTPTPITAIQPEPPRPQATRNRRRRSNKKKLLTTTENNDIIVDVKHNEEVNNERRIRSLYRKRKDRETNSSATETSLAQDTPIEIQVDRS